jgi:hypothetical protein
MGNIFNGPVRAIINKSPTRKREARCLTLQTTESVIMKLPRQNYQDAIISLEICPAFDIIRALFPNHCEKLLAWNLGLLESHSQDDSLNDSVLADHTKQTLDSNRMCLVFKYAPG